VTDALTMGGAARRWVRWVADAALAPTDDWVLLQRARDGDAPCARRLVQALTPQAVGLAMQLLRRREDAQDAVQEAFARLWRSRADPERGATLATYFNTIVINRCRSMLVAARREQPTDPEDLGLMQDAAGGSVDVGPAVADPNLAAALARLPARQRMAVVMWAYADASVADIARSLELDANAAHQLLHRAKLSLRRHLEGGPR
jgi:RNA polymerase sigma-70 factor (ECF subfamily)